jgi:hypothetical protein
VFATQRSGQSAWHEPVYDLHALEVTSGRHDLDKRTVERQRALERCQLGDIRLAQKLRLRSARGPGVGGVHAVDIFHDCKACRAQCIRQQEGTGVGPVDWQARVRELVVMIGRKCASDREEMRFRRQRAQR